MDCRLGFVKGLDTIPFFGFDQIPWLKFHHPNPVYEYDGYANILKLFRSLWVIMTCFMKYILQLLVSIVFLQMHKMMSPKNVMQLTYKYDSCVG